MFAFSKMIKMLCSGGSNPESRCKAFFSGCPDYSKPRFAFCSRFCIGVKSAVLENTAYTPYMRRTPHKENKNV